MQSLYVLVTRRSTNITHACNQRGIYFYTTCGSTFSERSVGVSIDIERVATAAELRQRATCKRCSA